MDREQLHKTVNQLVESDHDRHRARGELRSFRSSNEPPQEPGEFPNLQALLDFHEEQRAYEETLQSLQDELARIEKAYDQAEDALASVLPPNRMLHYDYDGEREEFAGTHITIIFRTHQGGRHPTIIEFSGPASE
jgi:uncharacterized protein (DUF3084 family)